LFAGSPSAGSKHGLVPNGGQGATFADDLIVVKNSYFQDFKDPRNDAQAILVWNGWGPFLIENNYLEGSGENVMFGGGDPSIPDLTPTDIQIRDNVLRKPLEWRGASPAWQVKNLFELKNARRVVVEHNVMERSWQQAQSGYAILFTVRNQDGGCPWCQVEDVQFRGNLVADVAAGVQILGTDPNHPSRQTNRIVIRDNVFDRIDKKAWGGDGYFLLLSDSPRDVTVDHNTIVQRASGGIVKIAHGAAQNLALTNNIAMHGDYGIIGTDHGIGLDSIAAYLPGATIARNVIAGGKAAAYPATNLFPTIDAFRRQFVAFDSGDYRLAADSEWRRAGTDGKDLGADLTLIPKSVVGSR
jgi:hypothetical protein